MERLNLPMEVRYNVFQRDQGRCKKCKRDTKALEAQLEEARNDPGSRRFGELVVELEAQGFLEPGRTPLWEPVDRRPQNLRKSRPGEKEIATLCVPCAVEHRAKESAPAPVAEDAPAEEQAGEEP